jgi:hypothetical protein
LQPAQLRGMGTTTPRDMLHLPRMIRGIKRNSRAMLASLHSGR